MGKHLFIVLLIVTVNVVLGAVASVATAGLP
jgi:hypothetical protein